MLCYINYWEINNENGGVPVKGAPSFAGEA